MKTTTLVLAAAFLSALTQRADAQPIIINQPQSQTNIVGTVAAFSVGATGTTPLFYQWQHDAALPSQTNATLTLTNVQISSTGDYSVVITNIQGSVTSAVATLTVIVPPRFYVHPINQSVSVGANVSFSFAAIGTPPLSYHLRFQDNDLDGVTNSRSSVAEVSLVVTNVQVTNAGDYVAVVTNLGGSATSHVAHLDVDPTFTKITTGAVVTNLAGVSCAWGDYDNDGFIDLVIAVAAGATPNNHYLFHNNRNGTFTQITNSAITAEARDWRGCAWADYDNDGNLDLIVVSTDYYGFASQNELFRNNGDSTFTKMRPNQVGPIASLAAGQSEACAWADYDRDGFIDLYIARWGPDWLFHNNGDGTFAQMTNQAVGLGTVFKESYGAMWGDYDNDGHPDLFVAVKDDSGVNQTNLLYHNQGDGTFARVMTAGTICADNEYSLTGVWGDYDNDGFLDLFVPNGRYYVATNSLYHNNGDGTFTKATSSTAGSIASDPCAVLRPPGAIMTTMVSSIYLLPAAPEPIRAQIFSITITVMGHLSGS
jgi:hypothetical protein